MIHVKYEKKDNYPHDRETLLFDRSGFQHTHRDILSEVSKSYNIFCPQVFVMECLAPENTDRKSDEELEKVKKSLREKLGVIENPIVLVGNTNTSQIIEIPLDAYYPTFLTSEQIAKNCITKTPISMKSVTPEKLISHYEPRIGVFKDSVKKLTEKCEEYKDSLTPNNTISRVQRFAQQTHNRTPSREHLKKAMKLSEQTNVKQDPSYVAKETLRAIGDISIIENIERLGMFLDLTARDSEKLRNYIQEEKILTVENYPDLAYPIYIYYLLRYMIHARQFNTQHLDRSYVRDFRYLHYLNFCDMFITNEKSTPHIVNSIPYCNIKETPIITVRELKEGLT